MFELPTVGSSNNTFAVGYDGTSFSQVPKANENVSFELDAGTPEDPAVPFCSQVEFPGRPQ